MSTKLTSNIRQGLDRMHHCAKQQDPMWFGMRVHKSVNKLTNEPTNKQRQGMMLPNTISPTRTWGGQKTIINQIIMVLSY